VNSSQSQGRDCVFALLATRSPGAALFCWDVEIQANDPHVSTEDGRVHPASVFCLFCSFLFRRQHCHGGGRWIKRGRLGESHGDDDDGNCGKELGS
jgi:hypothetical protein